MKSRSMREWWRRAVVYQIYTRSFQDSNGDGVGDFQGVIRRLDDLKELGVDALWLSPFCKSPNDDNGYDVSDYYSVQPEFGTMEDLEELIAEAGKRGMKVMMDLVFNHSSDEHPWFQESRSSLDNPKRDWYLWRPPRDGRLPNNWDSFFGGPAWELDPRTGEYYCHIFSRKQPDLNWANPEVRAELKNIALFWIRKGIAAFRLDAIHLIGKPLDLRDFPEGTGKSFRVWENTPETHRYLQEFAREVFEPHDVFTVGETGGTTPASARLYTARSRQELTTIFHFDHHHLRDNHDIHALLRNWELWQRHLGRDAWDAPFLSNHDLARVVSTFGEDGIWRVRSAQALGALLLTAWGTPFVYQGEEYGFPNAYFPDRDHYRDHHSAYLVDRFLEKGVLPDEVWNGYRFQTRDNARVPMSWEGTSKAGFTEGQPWMPLHPRASEIHAEADRRADVSVFGFFRDLIRLRKSHPTLVEGDYRVVSRGGPIGVILRRLVGHRPAVILINLSSKALSLDLGPLGYRRWNRGQGLQLGNYLDDGRTPDVNHPFYRPRARRGEALERSVWLRPWEARVYL